MPTGEEPATYLVVFTPEAEDQLDELHRYIAKAAARQVADDYVDAIVGFCEGLGMFPMRGMARDDIRPGLRTVGYRKRTVIAFAVSEAVGEKTVAIIGVFHGGRDYESILAEPDE